MLAEGCSKITNGADREAFIKEDAAEGAARRAAHFARLRMPLGARVVRREVPSAPPPPQRAAKQRSELADVRQRCANAGGQRAREYRKMFEGSIDFNTWANIEQTTRDDENLAVGGLPSVSVFVARRLRARPPRGPTRTANRLASDRSTHGQVSIGRFFVSFVVRAAASFLPQWV